jgi:hypothetical protein
MKKQAKKMMRYVVKRFITLHEVDVGKAGMMEYEVNGRISTVTTRRLTEIAGHIITRIKDEYSGYHSTIIDKGETIFDFVPEAYDENTFGEYLEEFLNIMYQMVQSMKKGKRRLRSSAELERLVAVLGSIMVSMDWADSAIACKSHVKEDSE